MLDEESLAVLATPLAVSLEFGFGFGPAKTVEWWAGLIAGPAAVASLVTLFGLGRHTWLVRAAAGVLALWVANLSGLIAVAPPTEQTLRSSYSVLLSTGSKSR